MKPNFVLSTVIVMIRTNLRWVFTAAIFMSLVLLATGHSAARRSASAWTALGPYGGSIGALAVDPSHPATLYAAADNVGVFKSTDSGAHWIRTGLSRPVVCSAIVVDPGNRSIVMAATFTGFFVSQDAGSTWTSRNNGLAITYLFDLEADPAHPGTLYAGALGALYK
ncbi:MAG: hypothetical protein HY650_04075, partial [Acidobacteria bacterium]|nr:hypothetical protein [Acidobacteriota bacterium]